MYSSVIRVLAWTAIFEASMLEPPTSCRHVMLARRSECGPKPGKSAHSDEADHDSGLMPITLGRPRNADRHPRNARLNDLSRSGAGQTGGACRLHWEVEVSGCRRRGCPCARSERSYGLNRSA